MHALRSNGVVCTHSSSIALDSLKYLKYSKLARDIPTIEIIRIATMLFQYSLVSVVLGADAGNSGGSIGGLE